MSLLRKVFTHKRVLDGVKTWVVYWQCHNGAFYDDIGQYAQAFTNLADAEEFAKSLKEAAKFIGYGAKMCIKIEEQAHGL